MGPGNLGRILELGFNQKVDVAAFAGIVGARTDRVSACGCRTWSSG
jgi:hypothetical protein